MVPGTRMTPNQTSNPASFVVIGNCFLVPFSESIKARLSRITVLLVPLGALFQVQLALKGAISRKCFSLPNFKPGIPNFNHRRKSRVNINCLHSIVSQKEVDFRLEEIQTYQETMRPYLQIGNATLPPKKLQGLVTSHPERNGCLGDY